MRYLEERVIKNEEVISQLATGQIAMQQSMTEINTTLNLLLKMGKPALLVITAIFAKIGIDVSGVM